MLFGADNLYRFRFSFSCQHKISVTIEEQSSLDYSITRQCHDNIHLLFVAVFSGVRVTRSLVLCACFVDRCLSFCMFSLGHCVICSSSIYGFWLPLWYFQTLLVFNESLLLSILCMPYSDALPKRFDSIISIVFLFISRQHLKNLRYEKSDFQHASGCHGL
jgi:hypothetical protein